MSSIYRQSSGRRTSRPANRFGGGRSSGGYSRGGGSRRKAPAYIDPNRFIKAAQPVEAEEYTPTHQFNDFAIEPVLKQALNNKGFITPTPIQDQTIPMVLEGKDLIGIANTGTGKTLAFALPIINALLTTPHQKALIIAPTRELAEQIEDECRWLAKGSGLYGALLIGGNPMGKQLRDLKAMPRIVIGTPGRIKDHLERGTLKLHDFTFAVLDEVDRMLDMGFVHDVTHILKHLKTDRQNLFFSATIDANVNRLIQTFTTDPVTVSVKTGETSQNVHQDVVRYTAGHEKIGKLHDLLLQAGTGKVIVFDETQRSVERLSNELIERGFSADAIHGGKTQGQRTRALSKFKKNEISILVATDVAARGIDVPDITHVINYTTPQSYEDYVHRIGRTGRANKVGHAFTFVQSYGG
jgi:ATP-dependent RNA helicase RhlE